MSSPVIGSGKIYSTGHDILPVEQSSGQAESDCYPCNTYDDWKHMPVIIITFRVHCYVICPAACVTSSRIMKATHLEEVLKSLPAWFLHVLWPKQHVIFSSKDVPLCSCGKLRVMALVRIVLRVFQMLLTYNWRKEVSHTCYRFIIWQQHVASGKKIIHHVW